MITFPDLIKAQFIKRHNRFVAEVILNNKTVLVHVPNTGRMGELLIPGVEVLLKEAHGKYAYKMIFVDYKGKAILIDSILTNKLFQDLFENNLVPGYEDCKIIKREPTFENHRFDFLIEHSNKEEEFIELKSCTLAYETAASFPDAISDRATNHLKALARSKKGTVIFFLFHENIMTFTPNYHTDYVFYETLKSLQNKISIKAFSIERSNDLDISGLNPVNIIIPEITERGFLILLLKDEDENYRIHLFSNIENNSIFRVAKKLKSNKKFIIEDKSYHVDHILPIITETAADDIKYFDESILSNSSYSNKNSGLYLFKKNPMTTSHFWDIILHIRYNKFN